MGLELSVWANVFTIIHYLSESNNIFIGICLSLRGIFYRETYKFTPTVDTFYISFTYPFISVWKEPIGGADCGDEAADWFSDYLKKPARLVYAVADQNRRRTEERGNTKDKVCQINKISLQ